MSDLYKEELRKDLLEPYKTPEPFDPYNGPTTGRPIFWNEDKHCEAIWQMVLADEIQLALEMCDKVPGYFRDFRSSKIEQMRRKIYEQTYDQIRYATDDEEAECVRVFGEQQWHSTYCYPRAEILERSIKALDKAPWIYDVGCSHGNLPLGLMKYGFKFSYCGVGMNYRIVSKLKEWVGDVWRDKPENGQPTILTCYETLEHCFNPHDLVHTALKKGVDFDQIHLSTPLYTLGGGLPDQERQRGHVRTWTPTEFINWANTSFPGYKWEFIRAFSMVLVGTK